jgi:hypothetical protein
MLSFVSRFFGGRGKSWRRAEGLVRDHKEKDSGDTRPFCFSAVNKPCENKNIILLGT